MTGLKQVILAACMALMAGTAALAQGSQVSLGMSDHDTSQPIEITSEELRVDQAGGSATFIGNVIIGQGDMRLTADWVRVDYAENAETGETDITVMRARGGVTIVGPDEAAEADEAVYTLATSTVVMTGNVLVTQGPSALSADRLVYNLDTGEGQMEGRVKTVLQAEQN